MKKEFIQHLQVWKFLVTQAWIRKDSARRLAQFMLQRGNGKIQNKQRHIGPIYSQHAFRSHNSTMFPSSPSHPFLKGNLLFTRKKCYQVAFTFSRSTVEFRLIIEKNFCGFFFWVRKLINILACIIWVFFSLSNNF